MPMLSGFMAAAHSTACAVWRNAAAGCVSAALAVLFTPGIAQSPRPSVQQPEIVLQSGHQISTLVMSQDGGLVATAGGAEGDGTIKLWQLSTDRQLRTFVGHGGRLYFLALSPDRRLMASLHEDNTIRIWNIVTGREL